MITLRNDCITQSIAERSGDWSFSIEMSVLEIYNEIIRDLLGPNTKTGLEIRHGTKGPYAEGLSCHRVSHLRLKMY